MNKLAAIFTAKQENNKIYSSQFACIIIIASITFKVVMLPKYLSQAVGRAAFVVVAIMMAVEMLMYWLVYYATSRTNLMQEKNKWFIVPLMLAIYIACMFKGVVFFAESMNYIASTLFDVGRMSFIVLAFLPTIMYIAYKGGNTLGRLTQIMIWFVAAAMIINILFLRVRGDWGHLMPTLERGFGNVLNGCDKYMVWFGDYLPLLMLAVTKPVRGKEKKAIVPVALGVIYVAVVAFYVVFTVVYGGAAPYIDFAFSKMAVYTRISGLLGVTDFPTIIAWLLMSIIKLTLIVYSATIALAYFVKSKPLALIINALIIAFVCGLAVATVEQAHDLATSWARYIVGALQYAAPIAAAIFVRCKYAKAN